MESYLRYNVHISLHRSTPRFESSGDARHGNPSEWPVDTVRVDPPMRLTEFLTVMPKLDPLEGRGNEATIYRHYLGQTLAANASGRSLADQKEAGMSTLLKWWMAFSGMQFTAYESKDFDLAAASKPDLRPCTIYLLLGKVHSPCTLRPKQHNYLLANIYITWRSCLYAISFDHIHLEQLLILLLLEKSITQRRIN